MKKLLPYGISDFKRVVSERYYIDKTMFIPLLEKYGDYLYLIRPRRFGKSLFLNMLDFYYNVKYRDEFELLKDLYIYSNPTKERNSYHILKFDFSAVSTVGDVNDNFNNYCNIELKSFCETYNLTIDIDSKDSIIYNLQKLFKYIKSNNLNLYILIDEYDNFINNLLVNDKTTYEKLVSSQEAIYKEFFKLLKALTNQNDSPLKRMFFTGVSPLALFDVTSGSNIGINITNIPIFNDIIGINQEEYKELIDYYDLHFNTEEQSNIDNWYNNYKFTHRVDYTLYNTDMIFYYINSYIQTSYPPNDLIDINVRSDYTKLRYLIEENNRLNGNFNVLNSLFENGYILTPYIKESFGAIEIVQKDNFISLLYYLGYLTIVNEEYGELKLKIPNQTIRQIVAEFLEKSLELTDTFKIDNQYFTSLLIDLVYKNSLEIFHYFAKELKDNSSIRDFIDGESFIKGYFIALLNQTNLFTVLSEKEENKGYVDIFLKYARDLKENLPEFIIELKYLKKQEKLQPALDEAKEQIRRYIEDKSNTKGVIVIFRNWEMVYCDFEPILNRYSLSLRVR